MSQWFASRGSELHMTRELQSSPAHGSQEWHNGLVWVASRAPSYHAAVQCCFSFPKPPLITEYCGPLCLYFLCSTDSMRPWDFTDRPSMFCTIDIVSSLREGPVIWPFHCAQPRPFNKVRDKEIWDGVWDGVQTKPCQRALWKLRGGKVRMPFLLCYLWKLGMEVLVVDVFQIGQSWRVKSNGTYCKILSNGTALADHDFQIVGSCKAPYIDVTI